MLAFIVRSYFETRAIIENGYAIFHWYFVICVDGYNLEDLVIFLAYLCSELWLNSKGSLIENYGIRSWPGFNLAPRERRLTRDCGKKIMWFHIGLGAGLLKINTIFFFILDLFSYFTFFSFLFFLLFVKLLIDCFNFGFIFLSFFIFEIWMLLRILKENFFKGYLSFFFFLKLKFILILRLSL